MKGTGVLSDSRIFNGWWWRSRFRRWIEIACPGHSWLALTLSNYHEYESLQIGLLRLNVYLKLPKFLRGEVMDEAYGFYLGEDALVLEWNRWRKFFHYPWALDFHARWERVVDTRWAAPETHWVKTADRRDPLLRRRSIGHGVVATKDAHPYSYTLRSGKVQERTATIYVARMEWRRRWLPFTSMFAKVSESISIDFDDEVGERTGSWKGGCTGCGYELKPGETPLDCLRRMERERKF